MDDICLENHMSQAPSTLGKPKYLFSNFIVGPSNEFAFAACQAVAGSPGKIYNPLFIFGGVGLGKTHLLRSIGSKAGLNNPNLKVCYVSSEQFMNELVLALRQGSIQGFQNQYRHSVDLLLMDDIQFIAGKESTQNEFFHTFNALHDSGKQIVVTSDKYPKDIPGLEERLRTRFEWGLIADIQPPDMETRIAIIKEKAESIGQKIPDDVAVFLADSIRENIRELEGSLLRLFAFSAITNQIVTTDLAKSVLRNLTGKPTQSGINTEVVLKIVSRHFDIKLQDLKSVKRSRNFALPRQIAMYLARRYTTQSFPEIGACFGGKDHTTIMHGVKKISTLVLQDSEVASHVQTLEAILRNSRPPSFH